MSNVITDSRFVMWRTLFALTHVDDIVTDEEIAFMRRALEEVEFSADQRHQLSQDMAVAQDVVALFERISDVKDQAEFFNIARYLVHVDGEYGTDEQHVLLDLQKRHMKDLNVDDLVGDVRMEFDEPPEMEDAPVLYSPVKGENLLVTLLQKIFHRLT